MGLPISQKFVQMMGGTLRVNSAIAHGSTFAFGIQIHQADLSDIQSKTKSLKVIGLTPDQPQYRILVVEERLENRLLLMKILSRWGFQFGKPAMVKKP